MTQLSLAEIRNRVPTLSIEMIGDQWVVTKWKENWLGCRNHYRLEDLAAHRVFLGIEKLAKGNLAKLISRDTSMPLLDTKRSDTIGTYGKCTKCHSEIRIPVRWNGLQADGLLQTNENGSAREYGLTAIVPDKKKRPFVARFCIACQAKVELPPESCWAPYAQSISEMRSISEKCAEQRRDEDDRRAIRELIDKKPAQDPEEVDELSLADLIQEPPEAEAATA